MAILVVGDVMVDVVAVLPGELARGSDTPAVIEHHFGGSGANVAAWLGQRGRLAARIGADPLGEAAVARLSGPIERDPARATTTCTSRATGCSAPAPGRPCGARSPPPASAARPSPSTRPPRPRSPPPDFL